MVESSDPITLALVQNRLDHIARTMGWIMLRTARSPIFAQAHDFSCFLTDGAGRLVSQADGIPIHTGGGGFAARAILAAWGEDIVEGDAFLLNDPYAAGGNHLPDWVVARPVMVEGRRVGFACNRAHQSDIGGGAAGTYNPAATEIWQEGVRLPALKLVDRDRVREDVWRLLLLNSRTPDLIDGDLRAMLGSTRIGAAQMAALIAEAGDAPIEGILDHADRRFRGALAALPDGCWQGEDRTDNDCFGPADIAVRVTLAKAGERLVVDFTGSDPQIRGFKNSPLANTVSAVYTALSAFFDPDLPRNEGTFRSVEITAPEGSVVNPRPPAPSTMSTVFFAHEIIHAVWRALAQAAPERACAGWAKNLFGLTAGEGWILYHANAAAGGGAVQGRDGFDQIAHLCTLGGFTLPNVEVYEQLYPVRYQRQEFRCDSGGPGEFRGGTGVDYAVEVLAPGTHSFRGEGIGYPTGYGVAGGGWGAPGAMRLVPLDGAEPVTPPKFGLLRSGPVRIEAQSPGGGGWGDPKRRDPDLVASDLADGLISEQAAKEIYGR